MLVWLTGRRIGVDGAIMWSSCRLVREAMVEKKEK